MVSEVYYADAKTGYGRSMPDKLAGLFGAAGFSRFIDEGRLVAVKIHFGEPGNVGFLSPLYARTVVDQVRACGGKPFLTDTNTLYLGARKNAVDHLQTALQHGFSYTTAGAPVVVADGLKGMDYAVVPVQGEHFTEVRIAAGIEHADALVVLSHFKGHALFGFGGAIKNIGMGCASPAGKQTIHSDVKPRVKPSRCTSCGNCFAVCPADAVIEAEEGKARIDRGKCIGCAECVVVCPANAVVVQWKTDEASVQRKTAEYALGVLTGKRDRAGFFNFLVNVSPECDCEPWNNPPLVPDLGILASCDPVALDQASVDMVNKAIRSGPYAGSEDKLREATGRDWSHILEHGEKMGLGSRSYELIET